MTSRRHPQRQQRARLFGKLGNHHHPKLRHQSQDRGLGRRLFFRLPRHFRTELHRQLKLCHRFCRVTLGFVRASEQHRQLKRQLCTARRLFRPRTQPSRLPEQLLCRREVFGVQRVPTAPRQLCHLRGLFRSARTRNRSRSRRWRTVGRTWLTRWRRRLVVCFLRRELRWLWHRKRQRRAARGHIEQAQQQRRRSRSHHRIAIVGQQPQDSQTCGLAVDEGKLCRDLCRLASHLHRRITRRFLKQRQAHRQRRQQQSFHHRDALLDRHRRRKL